MDNEPKKKGRRPIDPATKKRTYSLSLSPNEIESLEAKCASEGLGPSAFVIKKLKLSS